MKIIYFGHNCFLLEGKHVSVLMDPWLSDQGAFFGSWFQWPVNHELIFPLIERLKSNENTILYISHEHQDHFDIATLRKIKPYIKNCMLPRYEDVFLRDKMLEIGFSVVELDDQKRERLSDDDFMELIIVDTGVNHDSAAIFKIDGKVFVNQNDCKIFDRLGYLEHYDVDYYAVQFSGATWHPVCYDLTEDQKRELSLRKVRSKLRAVKNAIRLIKPKYYIPSAGPAIFPFLDPELSFGQHNIFVHQPDLHRFLQNEKTKLIYPRPGDSITTEVETTPIEPPTADELNTLKKNLSCEFFLHSDADFDVNNLIAEVDNRLQKIHDLKFSECPKLIFDWGSGGVEIDLNISKVEKIDLADYANPEKYMRIIATKSYFSLMADPKHRWQDIYLSLRAKVRREPDIFNTFVNIFLFSDTSNVREGFTTTLNINDERILVVDPISGKNYEINRFCPHNGADLKNAKIDEFGNIICPRHFWKFALDKGGVCHSASATVCAVEVEQNHIYV